MCTVIAVTLFRLFVGVFSPSLKLVIIVQLIPTLVINKPPTHAPKSGLSLCFLHFCPHFGVFLAAGKDDCTFSMKWFRSNYHHHHHQYSQEISIHVLSLIWLNINSERRPCQSKHFPFPEKKEKKQRPPPSSSTATTTMADKSAGGGN